VTTVLSVHEYVTRRRVEHAQLLLQRTRHPLRDIAAQCGFSDQSHMTRVFSHRVGVTPGKYRAG
jgi:AraC family transcriptional regulator